MRRPCGLVTHLNQTFLSEETQSTNAIDRCPKIGSYQRNVVTMGLGAPPLQER